MSDESIRHDPPEVLPIPEATPREDPKEVLPVQEARPRRLACWYCGSEDLSTGLKVGTLGHRVGIDFQASGKFLGMY